MGTQKLKAAVISAGMIANSGHIPAYKAFSQDVSLEAVCDLNASAARDTALRHDIPRWYSDVAAMLEEVHPDLVSVCTPNSTHKGLVAQALKAGANVICEKPLTLHYADTVELYALAEKLGKQLVVCQTSRFQRAYFAARDYIADGVLGNIYYAEIDRIRRRGVPSWGTFHRKAASGGGALADIGIHALDAMLWMLGSPQVSAASGTTGDWGSSPRVLATSLEGREEILFPSSVIIPDSGFKSRAKVLRSVDFPQPLAPRMTLIFFSGSVSETSERIFRPS